MSGVDSNKKAASSFAVYYSTEKSTFFQTVTGGSLLIVFLSTWFSSLGSPAFFAIWVLNRQYQPLAVLMVLSAMAYLPWEKGMISNLISAYAQTSIYWYKKGSYLFETKEAVPTMDEGQKPMLYAFHPHGAFCLGWSILFCSKIMNDAKVRFVFSPVLYGSPLFRLWCRLVGNPGSASKPSMIGYMKERKDNKKRDHLALPPGGFEEATISCLDKDRVYIKKRVGFVKLALQHGYNVVPVYTFGENVTYANVQGMWKFRLWLNNLGLPAIAVFGSWLNPLLPKRHARGLKVVVGAPLVLPKIPNPTREDVTLWHDKYMASLVRLFEEHKEEYYGPELAKTAKLELW